MQDQAGDVLARAGRAGPPYVQRPGACPPSGPWGQAPVCLILTVGAQQTWHGGARQALFGKETKPTPAHKGKRYSTDQVSQEPREAQPSQGNDSITDTAGVIHPGCLRCLSIPFPAGPLCPRSLPVFLHGFLVWYPCACSGSGSVVVHLLGEKLRRNLLVTLSEA